MVRGRQAGRQAGRYTGRQAGRSGRQADLSIYINNCVL